MYEYKINKLEVYKSQEAIPQIAMDVEVFSDDGTAAQSDVVVG